MSKYTYILNNGHGIDTFIKSDKFNPYRQSKEFNDGTQLKEYEFNRNVVKYLSFMLRQNKIDCITLVPELEDISLSERAERANKIENSFYFSIHSNWFKDEKVHGFETHYYKAGEDIAKICQKHIGKLGRNRGIKQSNFKELMITNMPAILTENGFYSNEKECRKLMTNDFQYDIAYAHYKAIEEIEKQIKI